MILRIRQYPNTVLRGVSRRAHGFAVGRYQRLIDNMVETMFAAPGIGLAAPQVGYSTRIIVVCVREEDPVRVIINPVLSDPLGRSVATEGCLSIPNIVGDVERAETITVTGYDRQGDDYQETVDGLLARCIQHEVDHLDGILFTDKATNIRAHLQPE